jgi:hypothetical protein
MQFLLFWAVCWAAIPGACVEMRIRLFESMKG